jgi:hypothetical protein
MCDIGLYFSLISQHNGIKYVMKYSTIEIQFAAIPHLLQSLGLEEFLAPWRLLKLSQHVLYTVFAIGRSIIIIHCITKICSYYLIQGTQTLWTKYGTVPLGSSAQHHAAASCLFTELCNVLILFYLL